MEEELANYLTKVLPIQRNWVMEMEREAKKENVPIMEPASMHFVMLLIKIMKPKRILEIGTAIGYSALRMVEAYPEVSIITIEKDNERYQKAMQYIKEQNKTENITVVYGDAFEKIEAMAAKRESFDVIFIDAAKGQYKRFFELASPMLENGGLILSDNVLFRGHVIHPEEAHSRHKKMVERIQNYNIWLTKHPDFTTSIVPIGDGVAISLKNG
ncbi:O-methyltransferase [Virgibacillus sp. NKC19-3]|uniref:O-methyltransferase n=1 Tax=Virgibacillus saliphilus TaxID=2831674 RepID=UPI001C9B1940|nr:O-methyltransferase [Virgibacillus sp. NKC19-3]MBY7143303.1 O-methyltransferase [Virgibacillus sp. NKC19-3]